MSDILHKLGIKKESKSDFAQTLFYFMREFKINPLDEEYIIEDGTKIIKKGMPIPLFNALLQEMEAHYEREKQQYEAARRRR